MENTLEINHQTSEMLSFERFRNEVLLDYRWACISREASLLARKEVLTGKAKFGIFGDGKEVAQVAMAKFFREGDFRSGYYRDQTFAFATGVATVEQFFSQLYADPSLENDPFSAGRQMDAHFATPFINENGEWLDLANRKNFSADIAPTAGQMPRALGLACASKAFRNNGQLKQFPGLSDNGNEVCFCTIGDASTSEGPFWETVNAAGVLQVPLAIFVWDDGYGISVPKKYQTTKGSISEALKGMQKEIGTNGLNIYKVKGWDYAGMCEVFEEGTRICRETHTPVLFHVEEMTQPQGHSTSGSHERYKDPERLAWEREWDGIKKMREWIINNSLADEEELDNLQTEAKEAARRDKIKAWEKYLQPIKSQVSHSIQLFKDVIEASHDHYTDINALIQELQSNKEPLRRDIMRILNKAIGMLAESGNSSAILDYYNQLLQENKELYNSHLYYEGAKSALNVQANEALFIHDSPVINGFEILNRYFDKLFQTNPKVLAFGEDLGYIGDVNQAFAGLQSKYGEERIFDTGIREISIIGQGIGMAMRGLRPIAEIQYLDYILYGLQPLGDDVATLHYRTKGQQSCPIIVRTRGHRLEGIWHSGSPMGMIINSLRGMYICV
ncbi:MAG TPA: thiamine pyrophosphate-dependent enzyme, partial [Flavisolibacter sp.]|nr:thiamine pyrophosphate-dependent enzyme [Flavisolibacter sp.]